MKKTWISKYALTTGIYCCDWDGDPKTLYHAHKLGVHAHLTESDAIAAAEELRVKAIANLKRRIEKTEALRRIRCGS